MAEAERPHHAGARKGAGTVRESRRPAGPRLSRVCRYPKRLAVPNITDDVFYLLPMFRCPITMSISDRDQSCAWHRWFALLFGALLLMSACGGDGGSSVSSPAAPSVPPAPAPPPNRVPTTSGQIPAQTIPAETLAQGESVRVDVAEYFSDPDGDPLTYETTSSDIEVATVSVSESVVSLIALRPGSVEITVSVRDPMGGTATLSFTVTIEGFTVSGTISDGRKRAPVLFGVPVWVGDSREEATLTGADGEYRLPNLWGDSFRLRCGERLPAPDDRSRGGSGPTRLIWFWSTRGNRRTRGRSFITPRMIEPSDPTSLRSVTYVGRADRSVFDRRVGLPRNRQRFPVRGRVCRSRGGHRGQSGIRQP